jgi:hypothetical protein
LTESPLDRSRGAATAYGSVYAAIERQIAKPAERSGLQIGAIWVTTHLQGPQRHSGAKNDPAKAGNSLKTMKISGAHAQPAIAPGLFATD